MTERLARIKAIFRVANLANSPAITGDPRLEYGLYASQSVSPRM